MLLSANQAWPTDYYFNTLVSPWPQISISMYPLCGVGLLVNEVDQAALVALNYAFIFWPPHGGPHSKTKKERHQSAVSLMQNESGIPNTSRSITLRLIACHITKIRRISKCYDSVYTAHKKWCVSAFCLSNNNLTWQSTSEFLLGGAGVCFCTPQKTFLSHFSLHLWSHLCSHLCL